MKRIKTPSSPKPKTLKILVEIPPEYAARFQAIAKAENRKPKNLAETMIVRSVEQHQETELQAA